MHGSVSTKDKTDDIKSAVVLIEGEIQKGRRFRKRMQ